MQRSSSMKMERRKSSPWKKSSVVDLVMEITVNIEQDKEVGDEDGWVVGNADVSTDKINVDEAGEESMGWWQLGEVTS